METRIRELIKAHRKAKDPTLRKIYIDHAVFLCKQHLNRLESTLGASDSRVIELSSLLDRLQIKAS